MVPAPTASSTSSSKTASRSGDSGCALRTPWVGSWSSIASSIQISGRSVMLELYRVDGLGASRRRQVPGPRAEQPEAERVDGSVELDHRGDVGPRDASILAERVGA